jgi:signal transduction histidine kinase
MTEQPNVLLVDDQPAKLLTYQAVLQGLHANLVTANSAREALDQLLKTEFAVVLVDVCMPELDGFELAAMVRDHPRFRRTAIIFVSGVHLSDLDRLKGYECGAIDYLPVPIVPEILRAKVTAFVELYSKTQQLERLNRELELRVAERTAELEEASRRKDEFLAVLAHELRNPLAAIRTAADLISSADLSPGDLQQSGGILQRQVAHLVRLIDDLVDVSRITRGIIGLQREPTEISTIVAQALETTRPLLDARGHSLSLKLAGVPLRVSGDPARLSQVIANILHNAAKFTPAGGRITLSVGADGAYAVIRVKDSGIGIPPAMLSKVFDLFTQMDRPLDRASAGLGIGLALVRRLVEMHGGDVVAHSDGSGTGTEVVVRLPLLEESGRVEGPAPTLPAAAEAALAPAAASHATRILVVDDNSDAADALALILRTAGYDVRTAKDGIEALWTMPAFRPRVVLLDLGMPKLNGFDTARQIRELPWGREVHIVAVTGWGQPKDRKRTLDAGFNAHLVKPVDYGELLRMLSRLAPATSLPLPGHPCTHSPTHPA